VPDQHRRSVESRHHLDHIFDVVGYGTAADLPGAAAMAGEADRQTAMATLGQLRKDVDVLAPGRLPVPVDEDQWRADTVVEAALDDFEVHGPEATGGA
jgi:hypothetical protein